MNESTHPLRAYRLAQTPPLTLLKLAEKIGVTVATISRIETGKLDLSLEVARKIAAATGIPLRDLRPDLAKEFDQAAGAPAQ